MYAIVKCGGKQIKVTTGDVVAVEKLAGDVGHKIELADVLLLADGDKITVGTPLVQGAKVLAEVAGHSRTRKVLVFKKKRRQNYRRKNGHRQHVTTLKITGISAK